MKKIAHPWVPLFGLILSGLLLSCDTGGGSGGTGGTSPLEVRFGGTVLGAGYSHDAGTAFPEESSTAQTFTLRNTGTVDINLGTAAVTVSGSNASAFQLSGPRVSILAPGKETTFSLTFSPASPGVKTALVGVSTADPPLSYSFALQGTAPIIKVTRSVNNVDVPILPGSTIDLGSPVFNLGQPEYVNYDFSFKVKNLSSGEITYSNPSPYLTLSGDAESSFSIIPNPDSASLASEPGLFNLTYTFPKFADGLKSTVFTYEIDDFPVPYSFTGTLDVKGTPVLLVEADYGGGFYTLANNGNLEFKPLVPSYQVRISNTGNGTLTVTLAITDDTYGDFGFVFDPPSQPPFPVEVTTGNFEFIIKEESATFATGKLVITTNDTAKNPFTINLVGSGSSE